MTIKYSGARNYDGSCAIITYKNGKEDEQAAKVIEALENEGYRVDLIGCDDTTEAYIEVYDRDEYDELKEIYMEAKRA